MTVRVHLGRRWTERLCGLPETGMGYHVVDVVLRNGERVRNVLVFNAEELEWPAQKRPIRPDDILEITDSGRESAL